MSKIDKFVEMENIFTHINKIKIMNHKMENQENHVVREFENLNNVYEI